MHLISAIIVYVIIHMLFGFSHSGNSSNCGRRYVRNSIRRRF